MRFTSRAVPEKGTNSEEQCTRPISSGLARSKEDQAFIKSGHRGNL